MSEELQIVPIEEQISQELVKHNVTEAVISTLNEKYGHLKINGIEDKETYLLVKEGRKECKAFRVAAKKICEKGREEAVAIQKAWVAKQKDVTDKIAAIEDPLEEQEKAYEAAVAKEKEERKRKQEEQLIIRQQILTGMGALYSDGSFHLGEVSFEFSVVKESELDIWEESILPKFKEEYEKVEAERIEQERIKQERELEMKKREEEMERIKQEREAELKRQEEEMERKRKELEAKEAAIKKAEEDRIKREAEEQQRKDAEVAKALEKRTNERRNELKALGLVYDFQTGYHKGYDTYVHAEDVVKNDDQAWAVLIEKITPYIAEQKAEEEQKRLAEIEEQKEKERKKAIGESRLEVLMKIESAGNFTVAELGDMDNDGWSAMLGVKEELYNKKQKEKWEAEQEEKRKLEEVKRQQELEIAGDKVKWAEIMKQFNDITLYTMISSQYKKKMGILREKLEEIKSL